MAVANIKTASGALISVNGTTEEVNEILRFWQKREDNFKHRRAYYARYNERERDIREHRQRTFFSKPDIPTSPKAIILKLIDEGYFKEYMELSDIRKRIEESYGVFMENSSLQPTLMLLIDQNSLARERQENGRWGYKLKVDDTNG